MALHIRLPRVRRNVRRTLEVARLYSRGEAVVAEPRVIDLTEQQPVTEPPGR